MRAQQSLWTAQQGWTGRSESSADLLLAFGGTATVTDKSMWDDVLRRYPGAIVPGCSTGGEIHGSDVLDESLSLTSLSFDRTRLKCAEAAVEDASDSFDAGRTIGKRLAAADAAQQAALPLPGDHVAVPVSCIGRKLFLGQRICEEVEAVKDVLGHGTALTGFYSYGEVSPHAATDCAELHGQTMTITVFGERAGA